MPSRELRQSVIAEAKSIVIKMGTQLLTTDDGGVDLAFMESIAAQVAELQQRGVNVILVSSGAAGVGRQTLNLAERPTDIAAIQAVAAVGQSGLMSRWYDVFKPHGLPVAQMLLTRADFDDRDRYLNIRNCIGELHALRAIPIINENDTVSVEEIRFGDNDVLAALVTNAVRADLLVMLTVVDGLVDADGQVLEIVRDVHEVRRLVHDARSPMGSGGMETKLEAARIVTDAGELAVIAGGRQPEVIRRLFAAEPLGTVFVPAEQKLSSRHRWIGMTARPTGTLTVDDGAAAAVCEHGRSLLATGLVEITGRFEKGDIVLIRDQRGREVGRGLINYGSDEARLIQGRRSDEFEPLLGRRAYEEVVHRDNLVLTQRTRAEG